MILLNVEGIRKNYGPEAVLDGVSFEIRQGQRAAIVGPNGAGKTTLMRILTGEEDADAGSVSLHRSATMGVLEQTPDFQHGTTVWQEAQKALAPLLELARQAEETAERLAAADAASHDQLAEEYDHLQQEMHRRNAYHLDHKIHRILDGLGFARETHEQDVTELSGGQQNRLLLAKLLLLEPDLMLLDEPSNHLDIEATEWLEGFLTETSQAVLLVSHDRYLLDRVAQKTLELFAGTIDEYVGNYTAYQRQKAERLEVQKRTYERQQSEIAKLEDFVRRHHHGQKHAQAEDRRRKLERIERVAPPRSIVAPTMGFPEASRTGDIVIRAEHISKAFDKPLFSDLSFDILRGEKWGILGPNGTGKTTLLRCITGELELTSGQVSLGSGVQIGYFDQLLSCVDDEDDAVDAVRPPGKDFVEQQRRDVLARFGIVGDMVFQKVKSLSGGERNRVALARLAAINPNLILLDEPTNHLDLWARGALEKTLKAFDGTVIFVSHDRYFLNQVADHLLIVEPTRFRVIDGNYETFRTLVESGLAVEAASAKTGTEKTVSKSAKPRKTTTKPKRKFPYRKLPDLEQDIANAEEKIATLHEELASPDVLRDGELVKLKTAELDDTHAELKNLYEHWEEAVELDG